MCIKLSSTIFPGDIKWTRSRSLTIVDVVDFVSYLPASFVLALGKALKITK